MNIGQNKPSGVGDLTLNEVKECTMYYVAFSSFWFSHVGFQNFVCVEVFTM